MVLEKWHGLRKNMRCMSLSLCCLLPLLVTGNQAAPSPFHVYWRFWVKLPGSFPLIPQCKHWSPQRGSSLGTENSGCGAKPFWPHGSLPPYYLTHCKHSSSIAPLTPPPWPRMPSSAPHPQTSAPLSTAPHIMRHLPSCGAHGTPPSLLIGLS